MKHPLAGSPKFGNYRLQLNQDLSLHKRNYILKRSLTLIALVLVLLPATVRAQQSATIHWELVNPFRFIHDQETIDQLRAVYDELPADKKTAAALERKLQDIADAQVTEIREAAAAKYECKKTPLPVEVRRQCFEPYAGWFARVAKNNHARTCWDSRFPLPQLRTEGPCEDYIYPKKHRVRVWIANPETYGDSSPQWTVQPSTKTTQCSAKYGRKFCVEFEVPYASQSHVVAQFPNAKSFELSIKVEDRLIVGLGDSFAAGEGNPDTPAQFIDSDLIRDRDRLASWLAGWDTTNYPKKDTGTEAEWLDRRCHRSMYSYQFKTALHLALSNPQEAITFITFSCSGAVTAEIIDKKQEANERGSRLKPQLQALREVLQNETDRPRPIDYLLLSTGGNDLGFADYVAYILLRQKSLLKKLARLRVSEEQMKEDFEKGKFEKDLLGDGAVPGNYMRLQQALLAPGTTVPNLISVKGCEAGKPCERILLTPYPNILTDEDGRQCEGNRIEFDQSFGIDSQRAAKIETIRKYVFAQLVSVQRQVGARLGWTLIDRNLDLYVGRGFCARNSTSTSIAEIFQIPTWVNKGWTNFNPRDYQAYASRFRWFRLPVDSKMTTDQRSKLLFSRSLDVALEDVRSNIMHPTAEGLARTADLNVEAIRTIQKKTGVPQF